VYVVSRMRYLIRDFTAAFIQDMDKLSNNLSDHLSHLDTFLSEIKEAYLILNLKKLGGFRGAKGVMPPKETKVAFCCACVLVQETSRYPYKTRNCAMKIGPNPGIMH
jgi:hypothetical protein